MVRGVKVCGRSEVCGWGGVDVGGGACLCFYSVQVFAHVHCVCVLCVYVCFMCAVCFVCVVCVCVCTCVCVLCVE